MKRTLLKRMAFLVSVGAFTCNALAVEPALILSDTETFPLLALSANETSSTSPSVYTPENEVFKTPLFTKDKTHQYLGIGALALVALAAVSPKEEGGPHEYFATGSAVLASAAVTTGLIFHWDDFDFSDGLSDSDNLHVILAGLGTLAMIAAVSQAPETGHAGLGAVGGVAMATAIKITW